MTELHKEDQLLIQALQLCFNTNNIRSLAELSYAEWEALADNAVHNGVSQFLWHGIKPFESLLNIPANTREKFVKSFRAGVGNGMIIQNQLRHLLTLLQDNNILSIVLKGSYLAADIYKDYAIRPMNDIDILIDVNDACRLEDILINNYYKSIVSAKSKMFSHHYAYMPEHIGKRLEVHICLSSLDSIGITGFPTLIERAVGLEILGIRTHTLAFEDLILFQCYHLCKHKFYHFGLRSVCDIAAILLNKSKEIDWRVTAERAIEWSVKEDVILSMELVRNLLRITPPDEYYQSFCLTPDKHPDIVSASILLFSRKQLRNEMSEDLKSLSNLNFNIKHLTRISLILKTIIPPPYLLKDPKNKRNNYIMLYLENSLRQFRKAIRIIKLLLDTRSLNIEQLKALNKLNNTKERS